MRQPSEYTTELQSALFYYKRADPELSGELSVTDFREVGSPPHSGWPRAPPTPPINRPPRPAHLAHRAPLDVRGELGLVERGGGR
eukprot:COSAG01_NODE_3113_length_6567_cov_19.718615_11_plen_84_part_01